MCEPASMIVTKENVYWSAVSESHEDIIAEFHLRDQMGGETAIMRIGYKPPNGRFDSDTAAWPITKDQDLTPEWWDLEAATPRIGAALIAWQKAKVVMPGEERAEVKNKEQIFCCRGRIIELAGGTVQYVLAGGTVQYVRAGGTVTLYGGARPKNSEGNAVVIDRSGPKVKVYIGDGRCLE